jgi:serine/threonine protein phosphatase PrpC
MVALRWGSATDVGRVRTNNEDSLLEDDTLFAVADGMGGHAGGEVASSVAVQALRDHAERSVEGLIKGVRYANRAVWARAEDEPDLHGMGTTMTALALVPAANGDDGQERLVIAHVGDSRAYRFSDGELTQVTEDHSLVEDLVREGRLSHEEARTHPQRNIVTRALGNQPDVEVDIFEVEPYRGDRFVLASDGLFDEIDDDRIAAVLRRLDEPHDAAAELVRLANESGGRDNITVLVVDVVDDGGKSAAASAALAADPMTTAHRPVETAAVAPVRADEPEPEPPAAPKKAQKGDATRPRRLTVRSVLFVVVLLAIALGAAGAVWWSATSTYYVGFAGDDVAIFKGRPGGVLFIDPTLEERTELVRDEVPANRIDDLTGGHEVSSLAAAQRYVQNLEDEATPATTTTTSTSTSSTTTTAPTTTVAPAPPPTPAP